MDMSDDDVDGDYGDDWVGTAIGGEDVPPPVVISVPPRKSSSRRIRKRKAVKESWFPLASFIDLKDDDSSSWNWRNFIEVGGVL